MESQRETSVWRRPKSPEGRKSRIPQTGYYGHPWSQRPFPLKLPPLFHSQNQNDTGYTRLCIISTQKQTLRLTIGASEPVLTLPGESWESSSASASVSCLKGEWDDIPPRQSHPWQAALWSHHSPDQWLSGLNQPPRERENRARRSCGLQWAGRPASAVIFHSSQWRGRRESD